ncbi:MAG TPA: AAA family ATPase [Catalimonadaceae bacterium]|nr:AAA family ATPase [Catalimonadaceae bacterium]HPI11289.1 AAA family ATPase [Catalimonadaceae bacterium]
MITEIKISNFRSLGQDVKISGLGPLVVFTGRNGSGKSNILDALKFVADSVRLGLDSAITEREGIKTIRRWSSGKPVDILIHISFETAGFRGRYEFRISSHKTYEYVVKSESAYINPRSGPSIQYSRAETTWVNKPTFANPALDPMGLVLPMISGDSRFKEFADYLRSMAVYNIFPDQLRKPSKYNPVKPLDKQGENWASILKDLDKSEWELEFVEALHLLTGDIDEFRIQPVAGFLMPGFRHGESPGDKPKGRWFNATSESDGTLRVAGMLTALLQKPHLSIIGIEEPELTVHPGAISLIFDFIKQAQTQSQIFITTHSPELLDKVEPDQIRVVSKEETGTKVETISDDQLEVIKERLSSAGEIHRTEGLRGTLPIPLTWS